MKYKLIKKINKARVGKLIIGDNIIETPIFMPVGTKGSIKSLSPDTLYDINIKIILGNTFHLIITPGKNVIKFHNGLHKFMNWNNIILTDSGGFQTYSLKNKIIKQKGILFDSFYNINHKFLTPNISIKMQESIKSNIMMILDQCKSNKENIGKTYKSLKLSLKWAKLCKTIKKKNSVLFGIIQGGIFPELRLISLNELKKLNFDGYAIGGLSVGESEKDFTNIIKFITSKLPTNKPRYLMGIGTPKEIIKSVLNGIDMFDCVIPTRNARNGNIYTSKGTLILKNHINKYNMYPIDKKCSCYTCQNYTISYLYHLFKCKELLIYNLITIHNVFYFNNLLENFKISILKNKLNKFLSHFYESYK